MRENPSYIDTSVFDLFKAGPGPSSSHTIGPMKAAGRFLGCLRELPEAVRRSATAVRVVLLGSLSLTGKGHGTDRSVAAGLLGWEPETCDCDRLGTLLLRPDDRYRIDIGNHVVHFAASDICFERAERELPFQNTMVMQLLSGRSILLEKTYYSIGGGFIKCEGEPEPARPMPVHCYCNMRELQTLLKRKRLSLPRLMIANETALSGLSTARITERVALTVNMMCEAVERGLRAKGDLPGPIGLTRKAPRLFRATRNLEDGPDKFLGLLDAYALAVAEENAAGQRVVTAPTSGSAGVLPAVIYLLRRQLGISEQRLHDGFWAAAAVGFIARHNASISGAEVGCQGEIGVASAMAAALAAYIRTGSMTRAANAAEIALEHHLGMTCDPVGGYVQIPCIERNAVGAVTAYNAGLLASVCDPHKQKVGLDEAVAAMRETGKDMCVKYKETSQGGLAVCSKC